MEKLKSNLSIFTAVAAVLGPSFGALNWVDNRYAKASQVNALELRVSINELKAQLRAAQEELIFWRQQARKYPDDADVKDSLKEAEESVTDLKKKLEEQK
jgi:hypothetical protein